MASTRSMFLVLVPTPGTTAVIREPPADPELGETSISFGKRVKLAARSSEGPWENSMCSPALYEQRGAELSMHADGLIQYADGVGCR